eukprot:COSAG01_NODE_14834_length_1405_cov_0.743492_1_plen_195_part_10
MERGSNWVSGVAPEGIKKGGAAGNRKHMKKMLAENPVYVLAQRANISLARIPGAADNNMSLYEAIYTPDGHANGDPGAAIRTRANAALDCLNTSRVQNRAKASATVREGLRECGWEPKTPVRYGVRLACCCTTASGLIWPVFCLCLPINHQEEWAMDWAMSGEDASGEPARNTSIHSLGTDQTYQYWGPDDQFVI